jgi:PLP dependent protein
MCVSQIASSLKDVKQRIAAAAKAAGRAPESVTLVAVAKGKSEEDVRAAIKAGQSVFGENRVQEAQVKYALLRKLCPQLELHFIGSLQTNKAEDAVALFDVIETLDRPKLAEALAAAIRKTGRKPRLYIEVNIGLEPQKSGVAAAELDQFLRFCRASCGLKIDGLMCIPPQNSDPAPRFKQMKELAARHGLPRLSMGMSADYEEAIRCGATDVRVGTAIFGPRRTA